MTTSIVFERVIVGDFRNIAALDFQPSPRLNVISGNNGQGKTSLLEGIGYLATLSSFRSVPNDALVRSGSVDLVVIDSVAALTPRALCIARIDGRRSPAWRTSRRGG